MLITEWVNPGISKKPVGGCNGYLAWRQVEARWLVSIKKHPKAQDSPDTCKVYAFKNRFLSKGFGRGASTVAPHWDAQSSPRSAGLSLASVQLPSMQYLGLHHPHGRPVRDPGFWFQPGLAMARRAFREQSNGWKILSPFPSFCLSLLCISFKIRTLTTKPQYNS